MGSDRKSMEKKECDKAQKMRRTHSDCRTWTVEEDILLRSLMSVKMGGQNTTKLTYEQITAAMAAEASKRKISNCNRVYTVFNVTSHWAQLKSPIPYPPGWQQPHASGVFAPDTGLGKTDSQANRNIWTVEEDELLRSLVHEKWGGRNVVCLTYEQIAAEMTNEARKRQISNCNRRYSGSVLQSRWSRLKAGISSPPGFEQPHVRLVTPMAEESLVVSAVAATDAAVLEDEPAGPGGGYAWDEVERNYFRVDEKTHDIDWYLGSADALRTLYAEDDTSDAGLVVPTEADAVVSSTAVDEPKEQSVPGLDKKDCYAVNGGTLQILWKKAAH